MGVSPAILLAEKTETRADPTILEQKLKVSLKATLENVTDLQVSSALFQEMYPACSSGSDTACWGGLQLDGALSDLVL